MKIIQSFALLFLFGASVNAQQPTPADLNAEYSAYKKFAEAGDWKASVEHARKAYEIGKSLFAPDDKNNAVLTYNYGHNLKELRMYSGYGDGALEILNEALQLYEVLYGKDGKELIPVLMDIGFIKSQESSLEGHLINQKRALDISEKHFGNDSIEYALLSVDIGAGALANTPTFQVKRYIMNGYEILKSKLEKPDPRIAYAAFYLGKTELMLKNHEEATALFNETLASFTDPTKPSNTLELSTHGFLVHTYEELGQSELATQHCLAIGRMTPFEPDQEKLPLFRKHPEYPRSLLKSGKEGWVQLSYDIDESGFVRNIKEMKHNGPDLLVDSAIAAVKKWRFAPAFKDGVPVTSSNKTLVNFEIAD